MPNSFAYLMLAIWPLVCLVLFRKLPVGRALIWSILGAYLLLPPAPAAFDLPLVPALNKVTLPNLTITVIIVAVLRLPIKIMPESRAGKVLFCLFIFSPIFTVLTNGEPVVFAQSSLRGLWALDAISLIVSQFIILLGFILARNFLDTQEGQRDLLVALLIAGLVYSVPMLVEVRLSPQLNLWVYGYYQHLFEQSIRAGGYRPSVFLHHGIWVAYFTMTTVIAALALWRAHPHGNRMLYIPLSALYLFAVLVLCKTLSALIYAGFIGVLVLVFSRRLQIKVAVILALLAISYPVVKGNDLLPTDLMLAQAQRIDVERAHSLAFRFENEDILLERAYEKPLFGWGTWGRNHVHDPYTGEITSVSDGQWVIVIGVFGWVGYIAQFGLLSLPIFLLWREVAALKGGISLRRLRQAPAQIPLPRNGANGRGRVRPSPYIGAMVLLLGVNLVDMLPNATLTPLTWMLCGALLGHAEGMTRARNKDLHRPQVSDPTGTPKHQRTIL